MEGTWCNGVPDGPITIRFPNKAVYQGQVYNLRSHGQGKLTYASGHYYKGEFCYGDPHGEGQLFSPEGEKIKDGEWKRGKYIK